MNTRTRTQQRPASATRFPRRLATRRPAPPTRRRVPTSQVRFARRRPQKSTAEKLLAGLGGLMPKSGAKGSSRRTGSRKGKAGFALLAGAAGLALKNREKVTSMMGRKGADEEPDAPPSRAPGTEPATATAGSDSVAASDVRVPPAAS